MTIQEKQQEIINDFEFLEDWEQKYEYIIDLGKGLKPMAEDKKTEKNLITAKIGRASCREKV